LAEELVQTPLFAENEADFAVLVVPPEHREELVDLALAHGCDILSEKPIADSMEASIRIHRRVRESGRKMAVTMSHRFDQDKQTLERLVSSGDYGAPSYVVGRLTYNARAGYPWPSKRLQDVADALIFDMAVHHFDVIRALGGANARMVYARAWVPPWSRWAGGGTALTLIELENGVPAFYEISMSNASTLIPWDAEYWRVECELATLELDRRELRLLRNDEPDAIPKALAVPLDTRPAWANSWLAEMFVDWIGGGPAVPTNLDDNIYCAALTFAAIESARSGRVIDVPSFLERRLAGAAARA
jgi:predicted dehydrogenase